MKRISTLRRWTTAAALLALLAAQVSPAVPAAMAQPGPAHHAKQGAVGHDAGACDTTATQCRGGLLCDHGCAACWHGFSASLTTVQFAESVFRPGSRFSVPVTNYRNLPLDIPARPPQPPQS